MLALSRLLCSSSLLCYPLGWAVDSYREYSASALGAAVLVRNVLGAIFPLFAGPMYDGLGNHWATSLVAFLGIPLIP